MINFSIRVIFFVVLLAVLCLDSPALLPAQGPGGPASTAAPPRVSDQELQAFARMYVAYQRIRNNYEARMAKTADAKEKDAMRQEGNAKVKEALAKQGLTPQEYNRLFALVNGDAQLRQKALKLIEAERRQS